MEKVVCRKDKTNPFGIQGLIGFNNFEGTIAQYKFSTKFASSLRNGDIDCDCWKEYVSVSSNTGNGGGGSSGTSPHSGDSGNNEGTDDGNTSDNGNNNGNGIGNDNGSETSPCDQYLNNSGNCPPGTVPIWFPPCNGIICLPLFEDGGGDWNQFQEDDECMEIISEIDCFTSGNTSDRNSEKCINLLNGTGVLLPQTNLGQSFILEGNGNDNQFELQSHACLSAPDIAAKIKELEEMNIIDPCGGNKINIDVKELAKGLCFGCDNDGVGLTPQSLEDAFYEELEGGDNIEIPANFEKDCPCFDKILKRLMQGDDNFLCNMTNSIKKSKNYTQKFEVYDGDRIYISMPNYRVGTIMIPKDYCNGNGKDQDGTALTDAEVASRFIHELLHGYMATLLRERFPGKLPDDFFIDDPHEPDNTISNPKYWLDLVKSYNNVEEVDGNHHVIFFTHFKKLILDALHALNGGIGNPSDYEYLANIIINTNDLAKSPWAGQLYLGIINENGERIITFDNSLNLPAWNNIGGEAGFKLKCD
ncbi:MAG: hypothetical protein IPM42_13440 [Saprospiraceae bacterium]|nr:hypothetical protein [Saprospiraceae bacterium]